MKGLQGRSKEEIAQKSDKCITGKSKENKIEVRRIKEKRKKRIKREKDDVVAR